MTPNRGPRGDIGERGDKGDRGPRGDGAPGAAGAVGAIGTTGDVGARGERGRRGRSQRTPWGSWISWLGLIGVLAFLLHGGSDQRADINAEVQAGKGRQMLIVEQQKRSGLEQVRNCIRANINSAVVNISASRPNPDLTPLQARQGRLLADRLYPLVDCAASQRLGRSVDLADKQKARYVGYVARGRAPIVRDGVVVGSRARVLQGVRSPNGLGKP